MSSTTPNLGLFKYNTSTDSKEVFSIQTALNNNWDILDEKVLGMAQTSNSMISAPNSTGIVIDGNTLILKAGTKYLIPNGRNAADGTLNNIEVTVNSDWVWENTINVPYGTIFGNQFGNIVVWGDKPNVLHFNYRSEFPTPQAGQWYLCFSYYDNKWYQANSGGDYFEVQQCFLGYIKFRQDYTIESIDSQLPQKLMNMYDVKQLLYTAFVSNTLDVGKGVIACSTSPDSGYIRFINGFTIEWIKIDNLDPSGRTCSLPLSLTCTGRACVVAMDTGLPGNTGYHVVSGALINSSQISVSSNVSGTSANILVVGW